ncbi:MAG TPA: sodium:solute symporter, partial [Phaeodactylibacter sp.]|nr:sodium:solute symporter [Phaeodactylibacter sp.]
MHLIDWTILIGILLLIVVYGLWKSRAIVDSESYLMGERRLKWWTIGLSVMATQASAITFLSTPGQAYEEGMGFAQFYFGLPLAMVLLCIFVLPVFYRLKVYTAYEFLEERFDLRTRVLTAMLFLLQRGLAAGITIFAPAIILSTILGWSLFSTTLLIGALVIVYTVSGGSEVVSQTQQQQMIVILLGMAVAFVVILHKLPESVGMSEALSLAGKMDKLEIVNFEFNLKEKYNIWSALLGGTFLFLSYFGTDQSQVQRYLSGKSLTESRLGLLFNGLFKVPMQFMVLLVGLMVFIFYQFNTSPLHFNTANVALIKNSSLKKEYLALEDSLQQIQKEKTSAIHSLLLSEKNNLTEVPEWRFFVNDLSARERALRHEARKLIETYNRKNEAKLEPADTDYVFIHFIMTQLPVGLIGLLLAVIFSAAMSTTASELNALATTSVIDIYKRNFVPDADDAHYLKASKLFTVLWGVLALGFAMAASLFENLIEAVNIIGSLFYGSILGIFVLAFFLKKVKGSHIFKAALLGEFVVLALFAMNHYGVIDLAYLWLNMIGCLVVVGLA